MSSGVNARRRVAMTRAAAQAGPLVELLVEAGFEPVAVPVIEIADPADGGTALRAAAQRLAAGAYDWLIATSVNTVDRLAAVAPPAPWPVKAAAIGPATAQRLAALGQPVAVVPERYVAESLLEAVPGPAGTALLPRAAVARDVLPEGLRARGFAVDVVEAYRTVAPALSHESRSAVEACEIVTFTSPSTVYNFVELYGRRALPQFVACIGPITAAACAELGIPVDVVAPVHTMAGLVQALVARAGSEQG